MPQCGGDKSVLALFLTPAYAPFAVAFLIMLGVGAIELLGADFGHGHGDIDGLADGPGLLDWLGLGVELPLLVWLISLLACFSIAGMALQQIVTAAVGGPLHWLAASLIALVAAAVLNAYASRWLAKILPGYESSVINAEELLMRRGTILEGTARRGHPARAKVIDRHAQAHYVMVEPHDDADLIAQGETALLVRKQGPIFIVLPDTHPTLRSL